MAMIPDRLQRWLIPGRRHSVPILTVLLLGFAAPLFTVVAFSFAPPRTFSPWQTPGLENYQTIIDETYYQSFAWSLSLALITVVILALICYPLAYGLAKVFGRWANAVT